MNQSKTKPLLEVVILLMGLFAVAVFYTTGKIGKDLFYLLIVFLIACAAGALDKWTGGRLNRGLDKELKEKFKEQYKKKKVPRTREGTLFEVATALILICSAVFGFATHTLESREGFLNYYLFFFIASIVALVLAYHPLYLGLGICSSENVTNDEQFKLCSRQHRVFAIEFALMTLITSICPNENRLQTVSFIVVTIAFFLTWGIFIFLNHKNR